MDMWECELMDVEASVKYNDNHRYILSVIDVFSKFLHMVLVKTKSGPSVASAFRSICMTRNIRYENAVPYGYKLIRARNF